VQNVRKNAQKMRKSVQEMSNSKQHNQLAFSTNVCKQRVTQKNEQYSTIHYFCLHYMRTSLLTTLLLLHICCRAQDKQAEDKIIWYDPITVTDKTFGYQHPRVALDQNNNPMVLWGDDNGRVFLARWAGKGFAEAVRINPPGKAAFVEPWAGPEITSRGDTVYIVYKETPEEKNHIHILHSYDGGKHFSIETQVDDSDALISRFPTVAMNPYGHPLVSYMKYDPGYQNPRHVVAKSNDFGETIAGEAVVKNYSGGKISDCCPATVVESGNATVILFRDDFNGYRNIWAGISKNRAISFDKGMQIDSTNWYSKNCAAEPPHGTIVGDTLYAVFGSGGGDSALIYLSKVSLTTQGIAYRPLTGKFPGLTSQTSPRIANSGNATAITWVQSIGINMQVCLHFTNDITTGLPEKYTTVARGVFQSPDVALGGGHIYVVYEDDSSKNIMCRIGRYEETITNKLLAENTTVALERSKNGKYFTVTMPDLSYCLMVDATGKEYEMDVKCKKNSCKINTEELDPGLYVVKMYTKDEKIFTYKYEVKEEVEKEEKEKKKGR
jgi:hypothetical protein